MILNLHPFVHLAFNHKFLNPTIITKHWITTIEKMIVSDFVRIIGVGEFVLSSDVFIGVPPIQDVSGEIQTCFFQFLPQSISCSRNLSLCHSHEAQESKELTSLIDTIK